MNTQRTTFLLNWQANPYHTPIFAAQMAGFYKEEGINLAILEPNDPSDVTEIVGRGSADLARMQRKSPRDHGRTSAA